ncbi:hypothetical protein CCACVL1_15203 [Corchorus capsularis]|uniref:Uncharacterized protein n=1 Tax=Corchorus capsularis TaxID=210143 RepID=A0A1R3I3E5_COCAP|nr:hypothetical protein CCACVL1_15203 [Corchorus capsularis]
MVTRTLDTQIPPSEWLWILSEERQYRERIQ